MSSTSETTELQETTVKAALEALQKRRALLSQIASRIAEIARQTGVPISPETQALYRLAMQNYMQFGRALFDVLEKEGMQVEQIVIRDGEPVMDPEKPGHYKTLQIAAPLLPSPVLPGALQPVSGIGAVPVAIIAIGGLVVRALSSRLFLLAVGGYLGIKALEQINITLHGRPLEHKPVELLAEQIKLYDKLVAAGVPSKSAWQQAMASGEPPEEKSSWGGLALKALGIGAAAFAAVKIFGKGGS